MSFHYSARILLPDGTASATEFASSVSENAVARAALRASNGLQKNTCVVRCNTQKNTEEIVQRINYFLSHGVNAMIRNMIFFPELQERIVRELTSKGMEESIVREALAAWNEMAEPTTPVQVGCFRFFEEIASAEFGMATLTEEEEFEAIGRMREYGGHFVSKLAEAWGSADATNRGKIRRAFGNYIMQYHKMGKQTK